MIEIIALIYLTRKIGNLATLKGLKPGTWKLFTVLGWFGAEFTGIIIGFLLFGQEAFFPAILLGLGCAITSYYLINNTLQKKPDVLEDLDNFGNPNAPE